MKKNSTETDVDRLARIVAQGFADNKSQLDMLTTEVFRLGDDIRDVKNNIKSHQQMLMDHEHRLDVLER